jgi:hypothetical protein
MRIKGAFYFLEEQALAGVVWANKNRNAGRRQY